MYVFNLWFMIKLRNMGWVVHVARLWRGGIRVGF
jgi:hypothetical protein